MSYFKAKNAPNSISALGELTALPQTPSCIKGALLLRGGRGGGRGRGGKGEEGKGERKGKGRELPRAPHKLGPALLRMPLPHEPLILIG